MGNAVLSERILHEATVKSATAGLSHPAEEIQPKAWATKHYAASVVLQKAEKEARTMPMWVWLVLGLAKIRLPAILRGEEGHFARLH